MEGASRSGAAGGVEVAGGGGEGVAEGEGVLDGGGEGSAARESVGTKSRRVWKTRLEGLRRRRCILMSEMRVILGEGTWAAA